MTFASLALRALAVVGGLAIILVRPFAPPADAAIEKTMRPCSGQLCPFYRTSFVPPEGWFEDKKAGERMGLTVFVPKGQTYHSAGAVIYAMARFNPAKESVSAVVADHHATWRQKVPDVSIRKLADVGRTSGEPFQHHEFVAPTLPGQPYERVATTNDGDQDGNVFVVRLVLTAKSEQALRDVEPTYLAMLARY